METLIESERERKGLSQTELGAVLDLLESDNPAISTI